MGNKSYKVCILVGALFWLPSVYSMDMIEQQLDEYEGIYRVLQHSHVVSPRLIQDIYNQTRNLDESLEQLPVADRAEVVARVKRIQLQYQRSFRAAVKRQVSRSFLLDQDRVYQIIGATTVSAVYSVTLSWLYFWLQQQTGNINEIDQTKLVVAGLEGIVAELIRQGFVQYSARVGNIAAEMSKSPVISLASMASAMAVHKKTLIARPTTKGVLMAGIKTELFVVFNEVIEKEGGVSGILKKVRIPKLLFGTPSISFEQQQVVEYVMPNARSIVQSAQYQQALQQVLSVATQSLLIGVLTYCAGLGFAEEQSASDLLAGAAFRGLVEGCFAYALQTSHGVFALTAGGGFGRAVQNEIIKNTGLTLSTPDLITVTIEKGAHAAISYAIDEHGGLGNFTKSIMAKTIRAVNQKWWIPFKSFCNQVGDTILDYAGVPAAS